MPIQVACQCGQTMTADDQYAGHQVSCIQCGQVVAVPAPVIGADTAATLAAQGSEVGAPQAVVATAAEAAPTLAVPSGSFQADAQAVPPQAAPTQKSGKPRRTFVADWAQGMAEQWADEHAENIASDDKPSTSICVLAGLATLVIGAYNSLIFGLVLLGSLAVAVFDTSAMSTGKVFVVIVSVFTALALWTLISGITCIARKKGGASAAIPLNLVWAFGAMFTMFQVPKNAVGKDFWFFVGGVVLLCCLGTVLSVFARTQAGRYQLWLVRKQQEADGTLNA